MPSVVRCSLGELLQPCRGKVIDREQIPDETFAAGILGDGIGVEPEDGLVIAPFDGTVTKRKVAGYARVSTDSEEQENSYEAQVDYFTDYIKQREDWEFVKVYTDEGISGVSTRRREGFNEMIADALAGKIELIRSHAADINGLRLIRGYKRRVVRRFRLYRSDLCRSHDPGAEGTRRGGLFPEGEYLHI